jgi:hypothetical protein
MFMMVHCIGCSQNQEDFSVSGNTDGVPLFQSSLYSMWPFYLELPLRLRNQLDNKIVGGVWFGSKKPAINTFLKLFCSTMKSLFNDGLLVYPPEERALTTCTVYYLMLPDCYLICGLIVVTILKCGHVHEPFV